MGGGLDYQTHPLLPLFGSTGISFLALKMVVWLDWKIDLPFFKHLVPLFPTECISTCICFDFLISLSFSLCFDLDDDRALDAPTMAESALGRSNLSSIRVQYTSLLHVQALDLP